jgi:Protein of unknown function (DUF3224)
MSTHATTTFTMKSWDEKPYDEFDGGRKLTRASVTYAYSGDLEGEGKMEYLMAYNADGSGNAIGLERVLGRVGGRSGSFVIQHNGTFEARGVKDTWFIVPGSGTEQLQDLSGGGSFDISGQGPYPITFDYDLG